MISPTLVERVATHKLGLRMPSRDRKRGQQALSTSDIADFAWVS